jgi:hypothetical protein
MPRVHFVKSARKAIPSAGIEVGDSYYWWKNRPPGRAAGFKRVSKTRPRPSQTVGSEFRRSVLELHESISDQVAAGFASSDDLESARDNWAQWVRDLADEQEGKRDNMPDSLQQGPTGELLQEREEALRQWADDLESVTIPQRDDFAEGEDGDQEFADELQATADKMVSIEPEV